MNIHIHRNNRLPVLFVLVIILSVGCFIYSRIQVSLFPEITFPKIKVIAENGKQPVDKMMITVTRPLENAIKQVQGLKVIRSTTSRGSCELSVFLEWKENIDIGLQQVESKINQIRNELPANTSITVRKMNPSILPVIGFTMESHSRDLIEMKQIANYTVRPFLSQVEGVSAVQVLGGKTKEYWVVLKPEKMAMLGITPDTIAKALKQTNFIEPNGLMNDYRRLYLTLTDATLHNKEDIEQAVIKNDGKRIIYLKDIADIAIHPMDEYIKINANGKEAVLVNVLKQEGANLVNLSQVLQKRLPELQRILPKDVSVKFYYNQADFVTDAIRSVSDSLWVGLLLAVIVAVLFLRSFRASISILFSIPVTIALTLIVLHTLGYTLNIMTLGAIAASIGLIIDDAIVVVEQFHRHREEDPEEDIYVTLRKSIRYLFPAMLSSSLSTIVIFIPFILMSGVAGAYFKVLTATMVVTLLCSFFVSWIGLPIIYLIIPHRKLEIKEDPQKPESSWLGFFLDRSYLTYLFILLLCISSFIVYSKIETGFLPEIDEGSIVLDYNSPPGTNLEETDHMLREVEKIIQKVPEVKTYSRRTGTQMGFFITEPNRGDYLIQLKKDRNRSTEEVINEIRNKVERSQPALRIDFGQVVEDMLGDLMSVPQPIEIKIFGDNQKKLEELSASVAKIVGKVKGTVDVFNGIVIAGPSVNVKPNQVELGKYQLSPADLMLQLQTQGEGVVIGSIPEKEQMINIRMRYPDSKNNTVDRAKQQSIFLPNGKIRPFNTLATIDITEGVAEQERENLQAMVAVTARMEGDDLGGVISAIQKEIANKISLPEGYHIAYGGAYAEQQQSFKELLYILIIASFLVFLVILFLFKELKAALIILLVSVLGTGGCLIALYLTGTPLNVGSYTGIIMIVGIIGENAIFTIQQFRAELQQTSDVTSAIKYAISLRIRPKLMTALGAIIALLPLALGIGTGAQMHQPLAIAVIGGFLAALPLLLIVLPTVLKKVYSRT